MQFSKSLLLAPLVFAICASAFAGDCTLSTTREACNGKETEALRPYHGKKTTLETKKADSSSACEALAQKESTIIRKGTLSNKMVTATFDGSPLNGGKPFTDSKPCN